MRSNWAIGDIWHYLKSALDTASQIADEPWMYHLRNLEVYDERDAPRGDRHRRGKPRPMRDWSSIKGVCIHQTASGKLGPEHPGILSIPAHCIIHQNGAVTLLHHAQRRMWHAHSLNSETIGIEVDCREYGISDDPRTFWRSKREREAGKRPEQLHIPVRRAQLRALWMVMDYYESLLRNKTGMSPQDFKVFLHRQGHKSRVNDPGQKIARHADRYVRLRKLTPTYSEVRGTGTPWPVEWRALV